MSRSKEIAIKAVKELEQVTDFGHCDKIALLGYFEGVASEYIYVGQRWVGDILRGMGQYRIEYTDEQKMLLREIFASGMCCEGQSLTTERERSFATRTTDR